LQNYLGYPEKKLLLQLFHCLGEDGANYLHYILAHCTDYDYAETQRHLNKYSVPNPIGCKKLSDILGDKAKCSCNFSNHKTYATPILHAKNKEPNCYTPAKMQDHIGHFKSKTPKHRAEDALTSLLSLNKKAYEIQEQQKVLKGQLERSSL